MNEPTTLTHQEIIMPILTEDQVKEIVDGSIEKIKESVSRRTMMDNAKNYVWNCIYILGAIGLLDASAQVFTNGELKLIHSFLRWVGFSSGGW